MTRNNPKERRRPGSPNKSRQASIAPPRTADPMSLDELAEAVVPAAVVVTVNVDCAACAFVMVTVAGLKLHLGMLTSLLLVPTTEHVRFTAPRKPPPGVTDTVVVVVFPGVLPTDAGVLPPSDSPSVCPVPFPQPAVQETTIGADAAEAM